MMLLGLAKAALHKLAQAGKRSSAWPALEKKFRKEHPSCAACGAKRWLAVHHVRPFHLFPALELEPSNLITLCGPLGKDCHLSLGHGGNWTAWNPNVRRDAAHVLRYPSDRQMVVDWARAARKA
ncbi:MAG: hypothetical protein NVS1B16_10100 [Pseudarthrobacter sp.]